MKGTNFSNVWLTLFNPPAITNNDKISYEYLMDAFMDLLDNKKSFDLFKDLPDSRYYYVYDFDNESIIEEYLQTGTREEYDKIKPTGKKYILK